MCSSALSISLFFSLLPAFPLLSSVFSLPLSFLLLPLFFLFFVTILNRAQEGRSTHRDHYTSGRQEGRRTHCDHYNSGLQKCSRAHRDQYLHFWLTGGSPHTSLPIHISCLQECRRTHRDHYISGLQKGRAFTVAITFLAYRRLAALTVTNTFAVTGASAHSP